MALTYWNISKSFYYSILFIIPMLFLYELMSWLLYFGSEFQIRNGADVMIRQIFLNFGHYAEVAYSFMLLFIFLLIIFFNRNVIKEGGLKVSFLLLMLLESFIWCALFLIIMSMSEYILLSIFERNIILEQFYLSIGAGIWEEMLFRVGVLGFIIYFLRSILGYNYIYSSFVAILLSAFLFSIFHYIGQLGDIFTYRSFYLRTFAGVILGILYIIRGFGITAYTHILYDMSIITIPIIMNNK